MLRDKLKENVARITGPLLIMDIIFIITFSIFEFCHKCFNGFNLW